MGNNTIIKKLAMQYFSGEISRSDEKILYDFIKQDRAHGITFKQWEKEWIELVSDKLSDDDWDNLERRISAIDAVWTDGGVRLHVNRFKKLYSIAAAVAVLVLCSVVTIKYFSGAEKQLAQYFMTEAPKGERSRLKLPDGTRVLLNAGSKLKYSSEFSKTDRKVELIGEAYFEVTKINGQIFTVHTRGYDVVVRGTKFDVAAYAEDSMVTTTLIEGRVELNYGNCIIQMKPGETMALNVNSGQFKQLSKQSQTNAWMDNRIEYNDITLKRLASILSIQYNVNIHIMNKQLEETTFSISLRNNEDIHEVMDAIKTLTHSNIRYNNKDIYINL